LLRTDTLENAIIALVLASVAMAYQRLARREARRTRFSIL
jgi:hypothetical protein